SIPVTPRPTVEPGRRPKPWRFGVGGRFEKRRDRADLPRGAGEPPLPQDAEGHLPGADAGLHPGPVGVGPAARSTGRGAYRNARLPFRHENDPETLASLLQGRYKGSDLSQNRPSRSSSSSNEPIALILSEAETCDPRCWPR